MKDLTERSIASVVLLRPRSAIPRPYSGTPEYFECYGEFHISFSKANASATVIYEHIGHTESRMFRMTDEVRNYMKSHKYRPPRQIYRNLIQMTNVSFEKPEAHIITGSKDVDDFKSAQLLVAEQDGYELLYGLQEPGISLAFLTPCFTDSQKFNRAKMTEVFIDATGSRLTTWLMELRNAGLKPKWVHTDKDFAEVTAASLAFGRNNDGYNYHLCLWHSLRAISQHISGKAEGRGGDSVDTARTSIRKAALPPYLHFLCGETEWILSRGPQRPCTADQANVLRTMIKRYLLRHPILPKVVADKGSAPESLHYETYEGIHASSIKEMLEYCMLINQPKIFRYFWCNWYRPSAGVEHNTIFAQHNAPGKSLENFEEGLYITFG
ncbi:uncharacterized protein V1513DRAFT_458216 [Lipomyces chichibuensis]|uniref:uncharacterized protein n=1 Tax=Lipomyces chichibuensis TaxID=1546026 RepID=UPI00334332A9